MKNAKATMEFSENKIVCFPKQQQKDITLSTLVSTHIIDTGMLNKNRNMYRLGHNMEMLIKEKVREYLDKGIIRASKSPWRSPVVMVPKKDGSF